MAHEEPNQYPEYGRMHSSGAIDKIGAPYPYMGKALIGIMVNPDSNTDHRRNL